MSNPKRSSRGHGRVALLALLALSASAAQAGATETLKVCAADAELPYANARGDGFEDKLTTILAKDLGMTVERVSFTDPRYVVRDLLDKGQCDVMMGVDAGDPRMETTRPYFRAPYVFITRKQARLDVRDWQSPALATANIGVIPGTPAEVMLKQIGRYADSFRYLMGLGGNQSPRNKYVRYDPEKLVRDVASGEIDVAVAWLPMVARYIRSSTVELTLSPVPEARTAGGERVSFDYDAAIGVRKGNKQLLRRLQGSLEHAASQVTQVLRDEGVLMLEHGPRS